jgi:hypothetical protein
MQSDNLKKKMLTVIIPTIGRPQLVKTLNEIHREFEDNEINIIIITQSKNYLIYYKKLYKDKKNVFILLNPGIGVSSALNTGILSWDKSSWLSFFSDDDIWLPGRKTIINLISSSNTKNLHAIFGSCRIIKDAFHQKYILRKPRLKPGQSPLQYVYPSIRGIIRNHYLSLTTLLIPPDSLLVEFKTKLHSREDIFWLEELYKSGMTFSCLSQFILAEIHPGYERTIQRDSEEQLGIWFDLLFEHNLKKSAENFFMFHFPKPFIRMGNLNEFISTYCRIEKRIKTNKVRKKLLILLQISAILVFKLGIKSKKLFLKSKIFLIIKPQNEQSKYYKK